MKICFIVSSCIFYDKQPFERVKSRERSVISEEERINQTYHTINTIREKVPGAYIVLVDNGVKSPKMFLEKKVDKFVYVGAKKLVKKASSINKSTGEAVLMLYALRYAKGFDYYFKISGRYYLNENFDISHWNLERMCFLHNTEDYDNIPMKEEYIGGSHNTALYSFPQKCFLKIYISYLLSVPFVQTTRPIETALPYFSRRPISYMKKLGLSGIMGGNGEVFDR